MWPDWVSNPGILPLESNALLTALRGPAVCLCVRERERGAYTVMSPVGNSTNHSHFFLGQKLLHVRGKASTFRVTKQTFIPTYMHQKILSCNKTRRHWRKCF